MARAYHYSPHENLTVIDPNKYGSMGSHTTPEYKQHPKLPSPALIPRSYVYLQDDPEQVISFGRKRYTVEVPDDYKFYDLGHDPLKLADQMHKQTGLVGPGLSDAIEHEIHQRGFHGFTNSKSPLKHVAVVFHPMQVVPDEEPAQKAELQKSDWMRGNFAILTGHKAGRTPEENEKLHQALVQEIEQAGHKVTHAKGRWTDSTGEIHEEPSIVAHDLPQDFASELAKKYAQQAHIQSSGGIHHLIEHGPVISQPILVGHGHRANEQIQPGEDYTEITGPGGSQKFTFDLKPIEATNKSEALLKPWSSKAQAAWGHSEAGKKALGGESAVKEWDSATKGKKLPEHVAKNAIYTGKPEKIGYSSHGKWAPIEEIHQLEHVERGNPWPIDNSKYKNHEAIWVNHKSTKQNVNRYGEQRAVDLLNAHPIMHDQEGGVLYARPKSVQINKEELDKAVDYSKYPTKIDAALHTHPDIPQTDSQKNIHHGLNLTRFDIPASTSSTAVGLHLGKHPRPEDPSQHVIIKESWNHAITPYSQTLGDFMPTNARLMDATHREVAFHNLARDYFGLGAHVPETSAFQLPSKTGRKKNFSAQRWIPGADSGFIHIDEQRHKSPNSDYDFNDEAQQKMSLMDMILGNSDRHHENFLSNKGHLHLIDNGLAFNYGQERPSNFNSPVPRYQDPKQHFTADTFDYLEKLDPKAFAQHLANNKVPRSIAKQAVMRLMAAKNYAQNNYNSGLYDQHSVWKDLHEHMARLNPDYSTNDHRDDY